MSVAATLLSAALYCAAFPPLGWWPLAWVALVPLFRRISRTTPPRAAALGLLWGIALSFGTAWWLPEMARTYLERGAWLGWIVWLGVAVLHAGVVYAPVCAWVAWRGTGRPLVSALAWGGAELLRTYVCGDPWALIAYSQVDRLGFMQAAAVAGIVGVGTVMVAANAAVAYGRWRTVVAVGVVAATMWAGGLRWMEAPRAQGPAVRIGVVQSGIGRGFRWRPEYRELGVTEHLVPSARLAEQGVDLLVWPEHAITFYLQETSGPSVRLWTGIAALSTDVILGGPHYEPDAQARTRYHNAVFLARQRTIVARYDKRWLLPIAETTGRTAYTAGREATVLPSTIGPVGPLVCFEAMFPELARRSVRAGATLLVNLTNDSWFGADGALRHHLAMARVRAIESHRPLVRAAATGYSAIIDPHGRLIAESQPNQLAMLRASITPQTTTTPFTRWGDAPLATIASLALLLASRRRGLRRGREDMERRTGPHPRAATPTDPEL